MSSTTIDRLRDRFWSGSLCSMVVHSRQIALPHMHFLVRDLRQDASKRSGGFIWYDSIWHPLSTRPRMKRARTQTPSRYETRNGTSFQRFSVRVRSVWKRYVVNTEDGNKPLTASILLRLGRVLSLGSGVIFRFFLFASTKKRWFVPCENDNP